MKIKIFCDSADYKIIKEFNKNSMIKGFTTNPSLMRLSGAKNYKNYSLKLLHMCNKKPMSLEVFADKFDEMEKQAHKINSWGHNIFVKIPVVNSKGLYSGKVIKNLSNKGIKLNITAVYTVSQVKKIIRSINKNSKVIISIFAGRIYDCGFDAKKELTTMNKFIKDNSNCKSLWASTRMAYDYINAKEIETNIITMQTSHIEKLKMLGTDLKKYSLDTVKQFYQDAKSSNFKI